jgi:DNA-binding IscR family transcriptional regulator
VKSDAIAREQEIPSKFLEKILRSLRHAGIVASQRGADGGFRLAKPPAEVSVADVIRALDGPLAAVREVWIATRAAVRDVLEHVTLEDIAAGAMPGPVNDLLEAPGAWERR